MGDTPDTARIDQIRRWNEVCGQPSGHIGELLDHIDTLTAERDALRAALRSIEHFCTQDEWSDLPQTLWWITKINPLLDPSPSPVEGGQP
jgi:hypothetical protein